MRKLLLSLGIAAAIVVASSPAAYARTPCRHPVWLGVERIDPAEYGYEPPPPYGYHVLGLSESRTSCRMANRVLAQWVGDRVRTAEESPFTVVGNPLPDKAGQPVAWTWHVHYGKVELSDGSQVGALSFTHGSWHVWAREEWERT
jgi:hypothetical protein